MSLHFLFSLSYVHVHCTYVHVLPFIGTPTIYMAVVDHLTIVTNIAGNFINYVILHFKKKNGLSHVTHSILHPDISNEINSCVCFTSLWEFFTQFLRSAPKAVTMNAGYPMGQNLCYKFCKNYSTCFDIAKGHYHKNSFETIFIFALFTILIHHI